MAGMRRVVMVVLLLAMVGALEVVGLRDACGSWGMGGGYVSIQVKDPFEFHVRTDNGDAFGYHSPPWRHCSMEL